MMDLFAYAFGWIMRLCYQFFNNYGVALIVFTLVTKLLTLPLSIKQQKNSAKMAYFKPKMDAIQKKYQNNREKMSEEMQKLYQEEGYSPYSGCLSMLITLPVLFGVIGVVYRPLTHILRFAKDTVEGLAAIADPLIANADKLKAYPDLRILSALNGENAAEFIEKATAYNAEAAEMLQGFDVTFLGIDFSAIPTMTSWLVLIPVFAAVMGGLTSWLSSYLMKTPNGDNPMGGSGKIMLLAMPVMTFFFALRLPAGIGFYWIVSNIFSMLQSLLLAKFYNPKKLAEEVARQQEEKKAKAKQQKEKDAETRRKINEERKKAAEEKKKAVLSPEEAEEKRRITEENKKKLEEARRRDAEKYGEIFVPVTDEDLE